MEREVKPSREGRPPRQGGGGGRPPRRPHGDTEPPVPAAVSNGASAQNAATPPAAAAVAEEEAERIDAPRAELSGEKLDIRSLKEKSIAELTGIAKALDVPNATALRKQELIFEILRAQTERSGLIFAEGVLETLPGGLWLLRAPEYNYPARPDDIYVSPSQVRKFDLHTGDTISGPVRPAKEGEPYFALIKVEAVNFEHPDQAREKIFFDNLTPLYPNQRIKLETTKENASSRVLDILCPIGKGQR